MVIKVLPRNGPRIRIWMPLGVIKWRLIRHAIKKRSGYDINITILIDSLPALVKAARKYVRRHGHFVLAEVRSHDGDYVLVKI